MPGDSFDLLYSEDESGEGRNDVRYASLTVGGETKKYYRYQTADDGAYDYYDETGKSAKKFLVRKPVAIGIMRSGFGERNHPLLHYMKMHTGVDWAAPMGTPIFAAGNGAIDEIGVKGGYGKYVRVRHANGYQTAYGHMTAFARGLNVGSHVRQGQVIGFVGSTGLSTGAHVHYEILVNNRFVDPMRIKLPRGRVLEGLARPVREGSRPARQHHHAVEPARRAVRVGALISACRYFAVIASRSASGDAVQPLDAALDGALAARTLHRRPVQPVLHDVDRCRSFEHCVPRTSTGRHPPTRPCP